MCFLFLFPYLRECSPLPVVVVVVVPLLTTSFIPERIAETRSETSFGDLDTAARSSVPQSLFKAH